MIGGLGFGYIFDIFRLMMFRINNSRSTLMIRKWIDYLVATK